MAKGIRTKHYQGFRGIDLANDSTLCSEFRSPLIVNMYKDYKSSFGKAIETFPGFRKSISFNSTSIKADTVWDMYFYKRYDLGEMRVLPIVHIGTKLYIWRCFPNKMNVMEKISLKVDGTTASFGFDVDRVVKLQCNGVDVAFSLDVDKRTITVEKGFHGVYLEVSFIRNLFLEKDCIATDVEERECDYFVKDTLLYIVDGRNIRVFDGDVVKKIQPYVPTTYIGVTANSKGTQKDFRNMISDYFKNTIVADGVNAKFLLSENHLDEILEVSVYGVVLDKEKYTVDLEKGSITFSEVPKKPIDEGYDEGYSGIEVVCKKAVSQKDIVLQMTRGCIFDGRLFLVRNHSKKNTLVYSALDDFTYFPEVNYINLGADDCLIQHLVVNGNELMVFKEESNSGTIFSLSPFDTGDTINPTAYRVVTLPTSIGTISRVNNFFGEPIFLSRLGIKSVVSPNLKNERQIENRSSLINGKLLTENLSKCKIFEWNGYLVVFAGERLYLGDQRVRFLNELSEREFEWFLVDGLASYDNQYEKFVFSKQLPPYLQGEIQLAPKDIQGDIANPPKADGIASRIVKKWEKTVVDKTYCYYTVDVESMLAVGLLDGEIEYEKVVNTYLVDSCEDFIGGVKNVANFVCSYENNLYFGNAGGVYSFNFDKIVEGRLDEKYYDFNKRIINCGIATSLDNLNFPNLRKSTVKKSLVIKCRTMKGSNAKVKVRTDRTNYSFVGDINNGLFDFHNIDFKNLSFNTSDQQIFMLNESERNWVEKQIFVYQDQYQKPFALYYITYQYYLKGKIKN